jgi:rRNA maturation protein Nop10
MRMQLGSESAIYRLQERYDSAGRKTLYNIVPEFGIHMKIDEPIKFCLIETYNKVRIEKYLSDIFPIKMV